MATDRAIWDESTHLLLISAVMKVEAKILKAEGSRSVGQSNRKWKQIVELLPPALRETIIDRNPSSHNARTSYKCGSVFDSLMRTYRGHVTRLVEMQTRPNLTKARRKVLSKRPRILTAAVMQMLKKREDFLRDNDASTSCTAGAEGAHLKTRRSARIRTLHQNQLQKLLRQDSSTVNDISSQGPSLGSVTGKVVAVGDQGAHSFSDIDDISRSSGSRHGPSQIAQSENSSDPEEVPLFVNNNKKMVQRKRIDDNGYYYEQQSLERQTARFGSGSESEADLPASESDLPASESELPASPSEFPEREANLKPAARTRVPKRDESLRLQNSSASAERRSFGQASPSDHERTSDSGTQPGSGYPDGDLRGAATDSLLSGLDREFSLLSSWIKSQIVPIGNTVVNEITSYANLQAHSIRSHNKRSKLLSAIDSEPAAGCNSLVCFDELIHESSSKKINHKIHASFQNLRILFAEELRKTSIELAHEVVKDNFLKTVRK